MLFFFFDEKTWLLFIIWKRGTIMNTSWVFLLEHLKEKKKRIVLVKFSRPTQRLLNPDHDKVFFFFFYWMTIIRLGFYYCVPLRHTLIFIFGKKNFENWKSNNSFFNSQENIFKNKKLNVCHKGYTLTGPIKLKLWYTLYRSIITLPLLKSNWTELSSLLAELISSPMAASNCC